MGRAATIRAMHQALAAALGPSGWWPGDTPFEVAVGAILTQNTNWQNVEKAIANLKQAGAMTERGLLALPLERLEELIRPSGHFRIKARRLQEFLNFLEAEADLDIQALRGRDLAELRPKLLSVRGIGPETADSILLYALELPTFVVDAYTVRQLSRHGLVSLDDTSYDEIQELYQDSLPQDVGLYNEYHALIVRAAKAWCRKRAPLCAECPLRTYLPNPDEFPE